MQQTDAIIQEVCKSFVGNPGIVRKVLLTLLAGGHVLLEDIPGVGKTTLALAFSRVLTLSYNRVQFTPDILPTDITGYTIYDKDTGDMRYRPGAAVCNLLLADEINRASSRAQSALLEVMEEAAVTVDGVTHPLPQPFFVLATQNPAGSAGTQLLPESQLDRFMVRLSIGYPAAQDEMVMLQRKHGSAQNNTPGPVTGAEGIAAMQAAASRVFISEEMYDYIVRLVRATRGHPRVRQGASPRCSVSLMALAQANAFTQGRDYIIPEDVQEVFEDCTAHRLLLAPQAAREAGAAAAVLKDILAATPAPRLVAAK